VQKKQSGIKIQAKPRKTFDQYRNKEKEYRIQDIVLGEKE
jgi:hypothetical protein